APALRNLSSISSTMARTWRSLAAEHSRNTSVMTSCSLTSYAMMSVASFSAAASAAIPASSTALAVAVTCAARSPPVCPSPALCRLGTGGAGDLIQNRPPCRHGQPSAGWSQRFPESRRSVAAPVQLALGDVLHDPVRDQVPDGLPSADPLAAIGRGDRQ